jgi:2-oxoglutarate ferredoxin oxidoreductase subunit beta
VIFNNGTHSGIVDKGFRAERTILLKHGEKMIFGKESNKGIVLEGLKLKAVTVGQDGYTLDDVLVHDAHEKDVTLHNMLAMMNGELPVTLGVIRDVDAPTYDESVHNQIKEVQLKKSQRTLNEVFMSGETWEIK